MGNYNCILANCIQLNGAIIITDFGALLLLGRTIRMKTLSSVRVSESGGLPIAAAARRYQQGMDTVTDNAI